MGFQEFVEAQVRSCGPLRVGVVDAVVDGEVPMVDVDDGLENARIRVRSYDRASKTLTIAVRTRWYGYLAIDREHEMTETGHVEVEAVFQHRGRFLELRDASYDVRYDLYE